MSLMIRSHEQCFNPRPPFPGGDAPAASGWLPRSQRFNPRPPFPGGDAENSTSGDKAIGVSIHAPRFREAMPAWS